MFNRSVTQFQSSDANCSPRMEKTFSGSPCKHQMCCINRSAKSVALTIEWQRTKCPCLLRWSTTIQITSNSSDRGRLIMKSIEMSFPCPWETGKGINKPNGCIVGYEFDSRRWSFVRTGRNLSSLPARSICVLVVSTFLTIRGVQ